MINKYDGTEMDVVNLYGMGRLAQYPDTQADSAVANEGILFGKPVALVSEGVVKTFESANETFYGIALAKHFYERKDVDIENDFETTLVYAEYDAVSVLRRGVAWVPCSEAVNAGADVAFNFDTGYFEEADVNDTDKYNIKNAQFKTDAIKVVDGGTDIWLAKLEINLPGKEKVGVTPDPVVHTLTATVLNNADDSAIEHAFVELIPTTGVNAVYAGITNETGETTIDAPEGLYDVRVSADGFDTDTDSVDLTADMAWEVKLTETT